MRSRVKFESWYELMTVFSLIEGKKIEHSLHDQQRKQIKVMIEGSREG